MSPRVDSGAGPYRGPADVRLHQQWRQERRSVVRHDHPDTGGDADVLQHRLEAVDRRYRDLDGSGSAAPSRRSPVRRVRGLGRAARAAIPHGWPGHRQYIDL